MSQNYPNSSLHRVEGDGTYLCTGCAPVSLRETTIHLLPYSPYFCKSVTRPWSSPTLDSLPTPSFHPVAPYSGEE